jgi:hypothetical protein
MSQRRAERGKSEQDSREIAGRDKRLLTKVSSRFAALTATFVIADPSGRSTAYRSLLVVNVLM